VDLKAKKSNHQPKFGNRFKQFTARYRGRGNILKEKTILIVDDTETIKFLLTEALKPLGYKIETAGNGAAAIQQLAEKVYDLVIADYTISKMNGLELIQGLKKINPSLPILVVNTNGPEHEILKNGVLGCIKCPLNTSQLQMITKVILQ
jgi:two-component system response regulator HydG